MKAIRWEARYWVCISTPLIEFLCLTSVQPWRFGFCILVWISSVYRSFVREWLLQFWFAHMLPIFMHISIARSHCKSGATLSVMGEVICGVVRWCSSQVLLLAIVSSLFILSSIQCNVSSCFASSLWHEASLVLTHPHLTAIKHNLRFLFRRRANATSQLLQTSNTSNTCISTAPWSLHGCWGSLQIFSKL